MYSCIPGWDARDTLSSAAAYMYIRMRRAGHLELSSRVYVYILAFLDGTRGTLWVQQPCICVFLDSWMGLAGHFELSSRVDVYCCIPGWDSRDSLSSTAAHMHMFAFLQSHVAVAFVICIWHLHLQMHRQASKAHPSTAHRQGQRGKSKEGRKRGRNVGHQQGAKKEREKEP